MRQQELPSVYKIEVDNLSLMESDTSSRLFNDFTNLKNEVKRDDARAELFARCYDLTMTYLKAKDEIKSQYENGEMTYDERQELMKQALRIKEMGRDSYNFLLNHEVYSDNALSAPYFAFWDAFYHGEDIDMQRLANALKDNLQQARDVFELRDNQKMSSQELGDACFKFASTQEFVRMAKLALQVENKHIHELGDYIAGVDRLTKDVAEKHAMEAKLTNRGFVTHYAFALDENKSVRDKSVNAVERYMLSTPDITNKIAQEFVHVGVLRNKICTLPQQVTFGHSKNAEVLMDSVRGVYEGEKGANVLKGSFSKVVGFFARDKADPRVAKDIKDWEEAFNKRAKSKMPQEILGRYKKETPRDMALQILLIDAKIERKLATEEDIKKKDVLSKAVEAFKKTAKEVTEDFIYGDFSVLSAVEKLADQIKDGSIEVFDNARYDNLQGLAQCDGERSMANLRLITYLVAHGEQEMQNNPEEYEQAMQMLDDMYGRALDIDMDLNIDFNDYEPDIGE